MWEGLVSELVLAFVGLVEVWRRLFVAGRGALANLSGNSLGLS